MKSGLRGSARLTCAMIAAIALGAAPGAAPQPKDDSAMTWYLAASTTIQAATNELAFGTNLATPLLFNAAHKFSMYSVYASYAGLSSGSDDPEYATFGRRSFGELAVAPFRPSSYAPWPVWGYVASMDAPDGEAVWDTGSAYLGDTGFSAWAGAGLMLLLQVPNFVMTGVGKGDRCRLVHALPLPAAMESAQGVSFEL